MDFRKLSDAELVDFAKNVAARLAAHEVSCLDNALADLLAGAIGPVNSMFEEVVEGSVELTAAKQSIIADKSGQRSVVLNWLSTVRNYLTATEGPASDFELCGYNYPKSPSTIVANDPTDLAGAGASNGVNKLRFTGNNKPGNVSYEVWRRHAATAEWVYLGSIGRQSFIDSPVTPGQFYEYKVRAVASRTISNWSNHAVVYGVP